MSATVLWCAGAHALIGFAVRLNGSRGGCSPRQARRDTATSVAGRSAACSSRLSASAEECAAYIAERGLVSAVTALHHSQAISVYDFKVPKTGA